jgi:hypothetical protein
MTSVLTTTKRSRDTFEDSTPNPIPKRPRGAPTESKLNAEGASSPELLTAKQPKEHAAEESTEDEEEEQENPPETIKFIEDCYRHFDDDCILSEVFAVSKHTPLSGRYDYRRWSAAMTATFCMHGLVDLVEGKVVIKGPLPRPLQKQLTRLENIAMQIIRLNLPESNHGIVQRAKSSHEVWEKLREIYKLSPSETSLEGWSIIKETKITRCSSAGDYIGTMKCGWMQVCMDRDDLYEQTQPMLCTALLHGLDGHEWAMWKTTFMKIDSPETDFEVLAQKVREVDPLYRQTPMRNPFLLK